MQRESSSFRDSSGFVFEHNGVLYRAIHESFLEDFEFQKSSGLESDLQENELLVRYEPANEVTLPAGYVAIKPERIPLITYPYEWGFNQLKDAAICTLDLLERALRHGMILKDASAFNIQFKRGMPVMIDTLSFVRYTDGQLWGGYRQFCEHFLAPLCIAAYRGVAARSQLLKGPDGIPLDVASRLLPASSKWRMVPLMHIHIHAKTILRYAGKTIPSGRATAHTSKHNLLALADHLKGYLKNLGIGGGDKTQWQHYDRETHYSDSGRTAKAATVREFAELAGARVIWDVGGNDGYFSRAVAGSADMVLSLDADPLAIDKSYEYVKKEKITNVYPLLFDVLNPSPDLGWANSERTSLKARSKPDLVMALAVIHHIAITGNVAMQQIAGYFAGLANWVIVEFVPPTDQKVAILPNTDGKKRYSRKAFDESWFGIFDCIREEPIAGSERTLLLLKRKNGR